MALFDISLPASIAKALHLPKKSPQRQQLKVLKKLLKKDNRWKVWLEVFNCAIRRVVVKHKDFGVDSFRCPSPVYSRLQTSLSVEMNSLPNRVKTLFEKQPDVIAYYYD